MPSLAEKLKALGVKTGAAEIPAPPISEHYDIASVLEGSPLTTALGETFVYEEHFAAGYLHGHAPIRPRAPLDIMSAWASDARLGQMPLEAFAFLDTETSGLAGGTGTYAFLVGVGRFTSEGDFLLQQFFMRDPSEEAALLEGLAGFLAPAQALVTFNGKAFDAPLLTTRYRMHRIPVPFQDFSHLDLLPLARRLWRDRLELRALKYLEENILQAPRTSAEVPGYEIPWLYFDYLRTGDARPLKGVFYHNAMDVVALAALLSHTATMLADPFHEMIEHGLDVIALARLYEDLGQWDTAARLFEQGLADEFGRRGLLAGRTEAVCAAEAPRRLRASHPLVGAGRRGWAHLCPRRAGEILRAPAARSEDGPKWTKSALKELKGADLPAYIRKHWEDELRRRRERLDAKSRRT